MKDYANYNLQKHNTSGIDVQCQRFVEYNSIEEPQALVRLLTPADEPILILGGGSNLLLTKDYKGTVIHSGIKFLKQLDDEHVQCGSGFGWDDFVDFCCNHQLYGAENLSIIPGEVGASAVQNIGAYGAEAKDLIDTVEVVEIATGEVRTFTNAECAYSYRQSKFKNEWRDKFLVTSVPYKLSKTYEPKLDYGNIRRAFADKNITTLLESRNEQALKLLSEKYGGLCSSISYNVLGNRSDSEEVTNDTYMKVWNTIPPEKPRSLCAYVAKIVRNLSLDKLRYNNRSKRCGETDALLSELEECIPATDNTEKSAENNELKSVLNTFLAQLDERTRKIFVLRYFACYSIADISERLAITETNTTSILNRTRTKLRKYLSDKDVYIQKGE